MPVNQTPVLRRARDLGDILNASFVLIRRDLKAFAGALTVFVLPFAVIAGIGQVLMFSNVQGLQGDLAGVDTVAFIGGYAGFIIGLLLASAAASAVVYGYLSLVSEDPDGVFDRQQITTAARSCFGRTVLYWMLVAFLSAVVIVGFVIVMALLPSALVALGVIGGIVAAMYFYPRFPVGGAALIIEDLPLEEALGRGIRLVKGYYWQTLGVMFLASILSAILGSVFTVPMYIVFGITTIVRESGSSPGAVLNSLFVILSVLGSLATALAHTYVFMVIGIQYFNLVERKEHTSLVDRLETLEEASAGEERSTF